MIPSLVNDRKHYYVVSCIPWSRQERKKRKPLLFVLVTCSKQSHWREN